MLKTDKVEFILEYADHLEKVRSQLIEGEESDTAVRVLKEY